MTLCLCISLSLSLFLCLSVCLSVGRSVGRSVCLSVCLSVGRSVCRSVCVLLVFRQREIRKEQFLAASEHTKLHSALLTEEPSADRPPPTLRTQNPLHQCQIPGCWRDKNRTEWIYDSSGFPAKGISFLCPVCGTRRRITYRCRVSCFT